MSSVHHLIVGSAKCWDRQFYFCIPSFSHIFKICQPQIPSADESMKDETPAYWILLDTHMTILLLSLYIFYKPPYKLFSTARSYLLGLINFFIPQDIFYRYNFTHVSPILCSINLHLHLSLLGSQIYKRKSCFYLLSSVSSIQHNFHRHTLCQQLTRCHHTIIFHTTLFDLTFRDYCGITLLLGHQYGSHYLYLNFIKNSKK
jgi:hypothetical protein